MNPGYCWRVRSIRRIPWNLGIRHQMRPYFPLRRAKRRGFLYCSARLRRRGYPRLCHHLPGC